MLKAVFVFDLSLQAGGHRGSAIDHTDIRGFEPHISVLP
jgi:hypothetical protein